jgi:hypothetical protein
MYACSVAYTPEYAEAIIDLEYISEKGQDRITEPSLARGILLAGKSPHETKLPSESSSRSDIMNNIK